MHTGHLFEISLAPMFDWKILIYYDLSTEHSKIDTSETYFLLKVDRWSAFLRLQSFTTTRIKEDTSGRLSHAVSFKVIKMNE